MNVIYTDKWELPSLGNNWNISLNIKKSGMALYLINYNHTLVKLLTIINNHNIKQLISIQHGSYIYM